ncbi:MAG: spore germination protein GerW family protein [Acutalibacteraceae bacterium]|jgi:sporulation protein YtfJ|nr:spore germination protein GerW family protein [Acutalibacteraceae bacterium]
MKDKKEKGTNAVALLSDTLSKVKDMIDVNTVIGEPIYTESGLTIIPVSKVTYGFASGGSDFPSKGDQELFGGAGGAGVSIIPIAFMIIQNGKVSIKNIGTFDNAAEKAVNAVPDMFDKVTDLFKKDKNKDGKADEPDRIIEK